MPDPTLIPLGNPPQPSRETQSFLLSGQEALNAAQTALAVGNWLVAARAFRLAGDAFIDVAAHLARDYRLDLLDPRTP